jgi:hypothetical protein
MANDISLSTNEENDIFVKQNSMHKEFCDPKNAIENQSYRITMTRF